MAKFPGRGRKGRGRARRTAAGRGTGKPSGRGTGKSAGRATGKSAKRAAGKSAKRAAGKPAKGAAGKPAREGASPGAMGDIGRTLAFLVVVLAFLIAAALFPLDLLGSRAAAFFPAGNPVGDAGDFIDRFLVRWLGLGSAAVPLGLVAGAASIGAWRSPPTRRTLWILACSLALLLPLGGFLSGGSETLTGFLGEFLGEPLRRSAGWLGGWVVFVAAVVLTSIAAFRFNPLGPPALALGVASRGLGRGMRRALGVTSDWWGRRAERRSAARAGKAAAQEAAKEKSKARRRPFGGAYARRERPRPDGREAGPEQDGAGDAGPDREGGQTADDSAAGEPAGRQETIGLRETVGQQDAVGRQDAGDEHPGGAPGSDGDAGIAAAVEEPDSVRELEAAASRGARGTASTAADPATRPAHAGGDQPAGYPSPPFTLLTAPAFENRFDVERELDRLGRVLVDTLRTFKISCDVAGRTTGPAVTQYEVVPEPGVKVNRIANLDADLALAMRAKSVRIVAPIPGKGAVGVEIPNPRPEIVRLREILEAPAFARSRGALPLGMGKDLTGNAYVADLTKMPHALIAGATGSGKSVCLNTIITSLVYRHGPDRLRLLLVDPKMVELSAYSNLPHLRHPVVTDPRDAAGVLKWAVMEMERRYALLSANGVRSLKEFNGRVEQGAELRLPEPDGAGEDEERPLYEDGPLPWIVVVVDELADLMMTVQAEVEKPLTQLAQKARAIGIHLLVATQRPSVNVITGLIKANFPCRIAFRVASKTDSRTILDQNGADSLLGYGDMLFLPPGRSEPVRMQGAFISTEETEALMGWYRARADAMEALKARVKAGEGDILEELKAMEGDGDGGEEETRWGDWDDLFREAAEACIQQGAGSTSLLQRRLRIGYGRAARIVDQLHDAGVLGPPDGSKPREVLLDHRGLDELCPV